MTMYGQSCRVCGCTEFDCTDCVERTGEPCSWIEEDLCSACEQYKDFVKVRIGIWFTDPRGVDQKAFCDGFILPGKEELHSVQCLADLQLKQAGFSGSTINDLRFKKY